MPFLTDLQNAIEDYPKDRCTVEIVNYSVLSGPTQLLNVQDRFQFSVKVTNRGPLNMKKVVVRAIGTEFADVGPDGATTFGDHYDSHEYSLAANDGEIHSFTAGPFSGRANKKTPATGGVAQVPPIVTARIQSWDADLDYLLKGASEKGGSALLRKKIEAS
jgi:hypothetical protein